MWEIRTREMVVNLKQHTSTVTGLKLLPDDSGVYSSSRDRTILKWDLRTESRQYYMTQLMGGINAIDALPSEPKKLISVGQEKGVSVWVDEESHPIASIGAPTGSPPLAEQFCIVVCNPPGLPLTKDYTIFATGGTGDCRVRLWKFAPGLLTPVLLAVGDGHSSTVRSLRFSPDAKQLVSVGDDGACLVWNIFSEEIFPEVAPPDASL